MRPGDLVGIPYKHLGRDEKGLDCWGLVLLYYRRILDIELPDYTEYVRYWHKRGEKTLQEQLDKFANLWITVDMDKIKRNDIIVLKSKHSGVECHCAVYIGKGKLIHCFGDTPVVIDRVNKWDKYISKVVRYIG